MPHTTLCERLKIRYPIILAGMACAGDHVLAATGSRAVTEHLVRNGGFGLWDGGPAITD